MFPEPLPEGCAAGPAQHRAPRDSGPHRGSDHGERASDPGFPLGSTRLEEFTLRIGTRRWDGGRCFGSTPLAVLLPVVKRVRRLDFDVSVVDAVEMGAVKTVVLAALGADGGVTDLSVRLRCGHRETAYGLGSLGLDLQIQNMRTPGRPCRVEVDLRDSVMHAVSLQPLWQGLITVPDLRGLRFRVDGSCVEHAFWAMRPCGRQLRWLHLGLAGTQLTSSAFRTLCGEMLGLPHLRTLCVNAAHNNLTDAALPTGASDPCCIPVHPDVLRTVTLDLSDNRFSADARASLTRFLCARPHLRVKLDGAVRVRTAAPLPPTEEADETIVWQQ